MPDYDPTLIYAVRRIIDDEGNRRWADAQLQDWLVMGCNYAWSMLPWSMVSRDYLEKFIITNADDDAEIVTVDTDIVHIVSVERKHPNSEWVGCREITPLEINAMGRDTNLLPTDDDPIWHWEEQKIRVLPEDPKAGYSGKYCRVRGIVQPDSSADAPELDESLHSSIVLFAVSQARIAKQDIEGARLAFNEFRSEMAEKIRMLRGNI